MDGVAAHPADAVLFGQASSELPPKQERAHTGFAVSHWIDGKCRPSFQVPIWKAIDGFLKSISIEEIERYMQPTSSILIPKPVMFFTHELTLFVRRPFVTHAMPRYISITPSPLLTQILGKDPLDHEVCSLIFRRQDQIDGESLYVNNQPHFRLFLEPDISVSI